MKNVSEPTRKAEEDIKESYNLLRSDEALTESEKRFLAIFDQASVGIAQIETKTGEFVRINKRYCDIIGYTQEEMISSTFMKITHTDDLQADLNNMQKLKEGKIREFSMEKRYYHKDGSIVWVNLTVSPMWNVGEQPDYHIAVVEDITERRHAEEDLLKSKETLDYAQKITHIGSWESDIVKNKTIWSDEVYRQFGLISQEFGGTNEFFLDFVHPDDKKLVRKAIKEALYKRRPYSVDFRIVLKDGTERILHSDAEVVFDTNGKPQKMIGTSLDITESKQVDKAIQTLVKSIVGKTGQEFFDKIVVSINEWLGADCAFIGQITNENNVKALSMQMDGKIIHDYGYTIGDGSCEVVVKDGYQVYKEKICELFPKNKVLSEIGAEGYVGTVLRDKNSKTIGIIWAVSRKKLNIPVRVVEVMDILAAKAISEIERKQIEEYLRNSEEALHIANEEWERSFNAMQDHICILDMSGAIIRSNKTMRERFEPIHGDLKGLDYRLIYCGTATPDPQPPCAAVLSGSPSVSVETQLPTMDGWQRVSSFPLFSKEKKQIGAVSVVTDITESKQMEEELKTLNQSLEQRVAERTADLSKTNKELLIEINERRQAEKAMRESEERYRKLIETANDAIFIADVETGIILDVNKRAEELMNMPAEKIVGMHQKQLHPQDEAETYKKIFSDHARRGKGISEDVFVCRKDGYKVPVEISASVIECNGKKVIQGIFRDVTERKKAEEILQEQKNALEQKNIVLSEILGQLELEKKQIKDNVIANAENLLLPVIQKLRLKGESHKYIQLLRTNVQELTSSFGIRLTEKRAKLTSRELEICNMIKNGLTNKEIAGLLNISLLTIEKHRANIRRKLGIINKDINLSSFLKTL